ncbi:MAG: enoyl-CoA hydratase-related protein [Paracoccaceae bacterium]|jgi:2-(1,2-epoxy-1,2-dihydrophenyl)acetyl-CoA isomerase
MEYQTILCEAADNLTVITLNRPEKMNALNGQMRAELTHAIKAAGQTSRAIVLTGSGTSFCSGQDLSDAGSAGDIDLERTLRDEYEPMLRAIIDVPVPVISAVNGVAAGAGANLALAADVVIASESAYFLQAFSRIGLMPDAGGTWILPHAMGQAKAMGAALFAEKITAKQADDWGMIWEAVSDDSFEAHWKARAAYLSAGPGQAFAAIKRSVRGAFDRPLDAQLDVEAQMQGELGRTRDFVEGVTAFLEKRPAKFEGR